MSDTTFRFIFDGPGFVDHQVDVADLAPALMALGNVVRSANKAINGNRAEARLKMKASAEGSFDAILSIDVSFLKAMADLLDQAAGHKGRIATAKELTDLLINCGAITGGAWGLFAVLKHLRGKRPDRIQDMGDGTTLITQDGVKTIVDNRTLILLQDPPTWESSQDFGRKLSRIPGLSEVRFDDGSGPDVSIPKGELASLDLPPPVEDEAIVTSTEREAWLKIVTAPFRDGYVWRFSDGGEKTFTATVEDESFFNKVASGQVALSANDTLRCRIVETQTLAAGGLTKETAIKAVIDFVPGAKQMRLL